MKQIKRNFFGRWESNFKSSLQVLPCSSELAQLVQLPYSWGRSTHYSDRFHDFYVTISRCYKDVYVDSFFPSTATLWDSLSTKCFPLTYDLNGLESRIKTSFNCRLFLNRFHLCLNLFVFLFVVIPCLVVAVQPCIEWIPILKSVRVELVYIVYNISGNKAFFWCFLLVLIMASQDTLFLRSVGQQASLCS